MIWFISEIEKVGELKLEQLREYSNHFKHSKPRNFAMITLRAYGYKMWEIARYFNKKSHASIYLAVRHTNRYMKINPKFRKKWGYIWFGLSRVNPNLKIEI